MKPIASTAKILADKMLNQYIDKTWVDWAVEMLVEGFDTEHLVILAGESPPYNQFYLDSLTNKVLSELNLDYSNEHKIIKKYVCYLIDKALKSEMKISEVLEIIDDLYNSNREYLFNFVLLSSDAEFLTYSDKGFSWDGTIENNIDEITIMIIDYFADWKSENCEKETVII